MAKTQSNYPGSLDVLNVDRVAGALVTSDSYDVIEDAITEIEAEMRRVTAKTSSGTLTTSEGGLISCSATGGAYTLELPASTGNIGLGYFFIKTDDNSNTITLKASTGNSEKINGSATYTGLDSQWDWVWLKSDRSSTGNNWSIVAEKSAGTTTFTGLTDTPASYSSGSGKMLVVTTGETAIEFKVAGETNTASNIGSEVEIYKQKTGVDLELRTLKANSNKMSVSITGTAQDMGPEATNRSSFHNITYTTICLDNPAPASGTIETIEIWAYSQLTNVEVATFYNVGGNNFSTRDTHAIGTVVAGSKQTFSGLSIDVEPGDYIGIHGDSTSIEWDSSGYAGIHTLSGDHIPCTNQDFGSVQVGDAISLHGIYLIADTDFVKIDVVEENIKLDDLGTPDDNTDLNASTSAHGLMPKCDGNSANRFDGTGSFSAGPIEQAITTTTGTAAIDWTDGGKALFTRSTGSNGAVTFSFTAPSVSMPLELIIRGSTAGSTGTVTWSTGSTIYWEGGTVASLSSGVSAIDIVKFYYSTGLTAYLGMDFLNFSS